ncbi:hypothetical protein ACHAAC_15620 [Aeromicrobium sp. CF4.19]|uniref:hypothetical protein n=1 Tax=Aeromicrobium sp. CF4.19 TaxID=3373082 RepID=UPI003EE63C26
MRTTITIDDDVLAAARQLASARQQSIGQVVSELARASLETTKSGSHRNGVLLLPRSDGVVSRPEDVEALLDELP